MTWSHHHQNQWQDLDALELKTDAGRRLDVGGFILADSFDQMLRNISAEYVHTAWQNIVEALTDAAFEIPDDLTWGIMHGGDTHAPDIESSPANYFGWTSRKLKDFDSHPLYSAIDSNLISSTPSIRCACTWRSLKWNARPDDFKFGLRLFEAITTDELTDWSPLNPSVLQDSIESREIWRRAVNAIGQQDQDALIQTLNSAKEAYSEVGFRIVRRALTALIEHNSEHISDYSLSVEDIF
ncbi:MAG: hypothetical protein AAF902_21745 [Chloroflexota bacterium]